jgi:hypothetical protein
VANLLRCGQGIKQGVGACRCGHSIAYEARWAR